MIVVAICLILGISMVNLAGIFWIMAKLKERPSRYETDQWRLRQDEFDQAIDEMERDG